MRLPFGRRRRRERVLTIDNRGLDAATKARKHAEARWPHVHAVKREMSDQRSANHFAERVLHALEGR